MQNTRFVYEIEAAVASDWWPIVCRFMREQPFALCAELRTYRPLLALPEVTLAMRHADCVEILHRHDISVAP